MSGVVVSKSATTTPSCTETLAAIANEIRARAVVWLDEDLKQYDLRLADRIDAAAKRERGNLDALERACENVLDAESLAAVIAAKKRIAAQIGGAA